MTLKSARVAALARAASGDYPAKRTGSSIGSIVRAASASMPSGADTLQIAAVKPSRRS